MTQRSNEKETRKGGLLKSVGKHFARLVLLCNLLTLAWLWACCLATMIPCDQYPYISLLTITFPIALIVNLFFVGLWVIVCFKKVWIPLVGMAVCWTYIMDYCPLNSGDEPSENCLKIVSWNAMGMGKSEDRDSAKCYVKNLDADIICLQEAGISGGSWKDFIDEMENRGYEYHNQKGLTIFTRFHIVDTDTIHYETRSNGSRWYLLARGEDTLMVINNHLESNHLSAQIKEEYEQVIDQPGYHRAKASGHSILSHMVHSARYRGNQAKVLRDFVAAHEGRQIILCGDFNDTPISYAYQTLKRTMKNAFRETGRGIGLSFNQKGFWVRIDHIFFSPEGRSYKTYVDRNIGVSDHYPIISWLEFK